MSIYEPAEDSFLLQRNIKKYAKNKSVLDMCSGSGIQAHTAIKEKALSTIAVDINPEAIRHIEQKGIKAIHSNIFKKVKGKFDLILCNPPYLPEDAREDKDSQKATTGGKRGDEFIIKFLKQAVKHMKKESTILLIVSSLTPQDKIQKLLHKQNMQHRVIDKENLFMEVLYLWEITFK